MAKRGRIDRRLIIEHSVKDKMIYFTCKNFKPNGDNIEKWKNVAKLMRVALATLDKEIYEAELEKLEKEGNDD
jgi:hypothetical protein